MKKTTADDRETLLGDPATGRLLLPAIRSLHSVGTLCYHSFKQNAGKYLPHNSLIIPPLTATQFEVQTVSLSKH
jgi:hypothetical protein